MKEVPAGKRRRFKGATMILAAAVAGLLGTSALRAADAPATNPSLESMGDNQLMSELASRGLDNLLDRYFEVHHVPPDQQKAVRALGGLRELLDPKSTLTPAAKLQRLREAAASVDVIIAGSSDPQKLLQLAGVMLEDAVNRDVNTIEYWGENPATQRRLLPVAEAAYKLLGAASKLAEDQANVIAAQIKRSDDPRADQWEKLDNIARNAKYQQNMSAYFLALGEPPGPQQKALVDQSIKYLADLDNGDSGVQPRVHNMIGKLTMAKGSYREARRYFAGTISDSGKMKPPPNPFEQYEARYFSTVADVLGKDLPTAQQDLAALQKWHKEKLPALLAGLKLDPAEAEKTTKGIDAAASMLVYRVDALESELAKTPEEKKRADSAAESVLLALRKDHPELAGIIDDQLAMRIPADRPVTQLNALLLQGLMSKGMIEYHKSDEQKPDRAVMQHAIEAARELVSRQGRDKDVTPQMVSEAAAVIPTLEDRLGDVMNAANGYIDYAHKYYASDLKLANQILDRAGFLVFQMKKMPAAPRGFSDLYQKFLETAVAQPFNHTELRYLLGEHFQAMGNPKEALPWYLGVAPKEPTYLNAQYKAMLCLRDLLDGHTTPAEHKQYVDELIKAAGNVKRLGSESKNDVDRAKAVQSTLVYAQLARTEQHNPAAALKILADFDKIVKGVPGEKSLQSEALFERVQSDMALGHFDQATGALVNLLDKTEGGEGIGLVRELLEQLDKQYVKADVGHDTDTMRTVAQNEARLTGFLGDWAKNSTDPNIKKYYYAYVVYDARTKRLAGTMTADATQKRSLLEQTLKIYQNLMSPPMHELYVKTLDPKKIASGDINPADQDPSVQTGLALTQFELGDYKDAQALLGDLLANRKLGSPITVEQTPDGPKTTENDLYWECTYKLLKCNAELAKGGNDKAHADMLANTVRGLKNILVAGGIPERWQDEFESLRQELIPDYKVPSAAQPAAAPTGSVQRAKGA